MSATARIERPAASPETSSSLGKVMAQSIGRTVVASRLSAGLRMGDRVVFSGAPQVLGVVTGFEAGVPVGDQSGDNTVFVEIRTVGVLRSDGSAGRGAAQPPMGGECFRLPTSVETLDAAMGRPVSIGERGAGETVSIDASKLLGRTLTITGEANMGKSASLAVIMRALLMDGFPARMVLIDMEGKFARSFGRAASVVNVAATGLPFSVLTVPEIEALLGKVSVPLSAAESFALQHLRQSFDEPLSVHQLAKQALNAADEATERRSEYLSLAARLEALISDERFGFLCDEAAEPLSTDDFLQIYFRLPHGQPPASVVQLNGLADSVRDWTASVLIRIGGLITESSGGTVPVLMALDQGARRVEIPMVAPSSSLGLLVSAQASELSSDGLALIHKVRASAELDRLVPGDDPLAEEVREVLPSLEAGEAILIDPDYPWPVRFRLAALPDQAVPRVATTVHADASPSSIVATISAELLRTPSFS